MPLRRAFPFLCLLLVTGAAAGAPATVKATIGGDPHEVVVPEGWSSTLSDAGVQFLPPPRFKSLTVSVVGIDMPPGTSDAREVARALATNEVRAKAWLTESQPEAIEFVGAPGTLVALAGQPPGASSVMQAELFVVSIAHGNVYMFTCEGAMRDVKAAIEDLAAIIGGVRVAGAKPGGGKGPTASDLGKVLGKPGGGSGGGGGGGAVASRNRPSDWLLVDQAFGLKLKRDALRRWRMSIADDEYQLERTDEQPHAVVAVRRVTLKNRKAYEKQAQADGRSRKTKFAGADALLVEKKSGDTVIRRYHVVRDGYALVFEFRVVGRAGDQGVDARVFELEQAVVLDDKGLSAWSDGATELVTWGGVRLATTAGWALTAVGPGAANFRNGKGVEVEVRVRPWPKVQDPFALAEEELKSLCGADNYTRTEAAVLGARQAVRFRCAGKKQAVVLLVAEGTSQEGERLYVRVRAENAKKKQQPADGEIAEFGAYVSLPR